MKSNETTDVKPRILIAEDSPTQAAQLAHVLEQHGFAVTTASDGREALALLDQCNPTLVMSDVLMPELDGYGLCKAIKATEKWKHIPVMLVTTLSDALDVIRGLECGADNFIRKPYDEKYLLSRIRYLLMNLELRKNQKMQMGVEINLGGQRHFIASERQQILDLLISTYEQAVNINEELKTREKDLAHSNQVLTGLYRIAAGLNQARNEREVAELALEGAMALPGIQAGWISLREGESGFRLAAAHNLPPALEAPGAMENDCACRLRLLSGELDSVTNILECERLQEARGDTRGLLYHAAVPLWLGDRSVGVMNLAGPGKGLFNEDELDVLYSVGNQVGVALERAHLREHLEKLVEERTARIIRLNRVYAVLSGINTAIVRVRDRQRLFEEACRIAVEEGKFTFAWIGTLDADTHEVTPIAKAGRDDGYLSQINLTAREDAPGNCELTARALARAVPVVCNDIGADERMKTWRAEALARGYRSVALFPLLLAGRPIGVFVLYAPEPDVFDAEEMRLLVEMADDISFALDHLRKQEQLTAEIAERERIEQEQRDLEAQLHQSQKMEAVGQLAAGIAHDFNNLLTVINGYAEAGLDELPSESSLRALLGEILGAGTRAASLTRQLLALSRQQVLQPRVLDLNTVVTEFESLIRRSAGDRIEVRFNLDAVLGRVKADRGQLEQILMNLVVNASHAMPEGGRLLIETANVQQEQFEDQARGRNASLASGPHVMLAVTDTGHGIDETTRERIFEPFFTTKGQGEGTGLGLATVYGIVKQSGGHVRVESQPGQGAAFKVFLPRVEGEVEQAPDHRAPQESPSRSATILLVEDDAAVRRLVARALARVGHELLVAEDPREAFALAAEHAGTIDLLLTDLALPQMTGVELATRIRESLPMTKVLFMSGYADGSILENVRNMPLLGKPFTSNALTSKVREVLESSS